jgi:hypothetical protein
MSRWFRVYDNLIEDPKVQRLSDPLFRGLVNLWCLASQGEGLLPPIDDIAFKLRIKPAQAQKLLSDLRNAGLIVDDETGTHPHNWSGRQFKSDVSNDRVKRYRERKCNVTETVTVARPETDTEQTTEKKDAVASRPALEIVPSAEADYFRRIKEICGPSAGGLGKQLLTAKDGVVPLARAVAEQASTKQDPREYIGAIIKNRKEPECRPDRSF